MTQPLVKAAPEVDGAPRAEIEVTPEMIEAGEIEFCKADPEFEPNAEIVARIYRAMSNARLASLRHQKGVGE